MRVHETTYGRTKPVLSRDYPLLLQRTVRQFGADPALLSERPVDELLSNRVAPLEFADIIQRSLDITNEPSLGLYFGRSWDLATMGVFGQAIHSSDNLSDALMHLMKYFSYSGLSMRVDMDRVEDELLVSIEFLYGKETVPRVTRFLTESILGAAHLTALMLVDKPSIFKGISFAYPNEGQEELYSRTFGCPVWFNAKKTTLRIDKDIFLSPVVTSNTQMHEFTQGYAENLLIDVVRKLRSLPGCIRQLLINTHGRFPTLEDMADCLHLSPRTLCRRLKEHNTSYQTLLNEVRQQRAIEYLTNRSWSVERIASQLGFSDASNFRRAFKQWTGETPGGMRERLAQMS